MDPLTPWLVSLLIAGVESMMRRPVTSEVAELVWERTRKLGADPDLGRLRIELEQISRETGLPSEQIEKVYRWVRPGPGFAIFDDAGNLIYVTTRSPEDPGADPETMDQILATAEDEAHRRQRVVTVYEYQIPFSVSISLSDDPGFLQILMAEPSEYEPWSVDRYVRPFLGKPVAMFSPSPTMPKMTRRRHQTSETLQLVETMVDLGMTLEDISANTGIPVRRVEQLVEQVEAHSDEERRAAVRSKTLERFERAFEEEAGFPEEEGGGNFHG